MWQSCAKYAQHVASRRTRVLGCLQSCAFSSTRSQRHSSLNQAIGATKRNAKTLDRFTHNDAIVSAANEQKWAVAVSLLQELVRNKLNPRPQSFSAVIAVCSRARRWEDALLWYRAMKEHTVPNIRVYTNIISCVGKVPGKWHLALGLVDEMRFANIRPDAVVFNTCITACEKSRMWQRALSILDSIHLEQLLPTVVSYSACISACEKGGAPWPAALHLFDQMQQAKIAPNIIAYNALISAMEKGHQWARALELLAHMRLDAVAPDVVSFNACISACAKTGEWARAISLLASIQEDRLAPDVVSYSAAISALETSGHWQTAVALLLEMESLPRIKRNAFPYNACISVCEKHREWQCALRILADMVVAEVSPDIYSFNSSISACEKGGEWQQALLLLDRMRGSVSPDVITFNSLISACEKRRELKQALSLFEKMKSPLFGSLKPNEVTFSALMSACEKRKQWATALHLLHIARNYHIKPTVRCYNACISACEKALEWERALALLQSMECAPDEVSFHAAVSACEKAKQWQQCLRLLDTLLSPRSAVLPNTMFFNVVIRAMTYVDVPEEKWFHAHALYQRMKKLDILPVALTYTNLLRCFPKDVSFPGMSSIRSDCYQAANQWGRDGGPFLSEPLEAIELLLEFDAHFAPLPAFTRRVRVLAFDRTIEALQRHDINALQRFAPPHLGMWTREALTALQIGSFDATDARRKVREEIGDVVSEDVRARNVVAHVKARGVDCVVRYGSSDDTSLPSVYLDHDRAGHAERLALLSVLGVEGTVELYITHRPCVSCLAAMSAFRSPNVNLKVVFD